MISIAACIFLAASSAALRLPPASDMNQNLSFPDASLVLSTSSTNVTTYQGLDIVIENCGNDYHRVSNVFRESRSLVLKALVDSVRGTYSKHGFKSMFKSNTAMSTVEATLEGIYYYNVKPGLRPELDMPKAPRLSCVTRDSAQIYRTLDLGYDPWQRCLGLAPGGSPSLAFYADGTAYLFLCPAYFALKEATSEAHCPTVQNNEFQGDTNVFYKEYQTYTLLYHLLRFYLGENALDSYSDPPEQMDWNGCVRLGSKTVMDSVRNPTSLQLYIALVSQGCKQLPEPPPYHPTFLTATKLARMPS